MYEHPYLAYRITEFEQEQVAQAAERRRFLTEHADQIVPHAAGPMRRLVDRMLGRAGARAASASRSSATSSGAALAVPASRTAASRGASASRTAAPAAGTDGHMSAGCEAVPAR